MAVVKNIKVLYILPLTVVILSIFGIVFDDIHSLVSSIILGIFFLLLVAILSIMIISYIIYRVPKLKILISSIIIPFIPFLFLYALPETFS